MALSKYLDTTHHLKVHIELTWIPLVPSCRANFLGVRKSRKLLWNDIEYLLRDLNLDIKD